MNKAREKVIILLSSFFYIGYCPVASGTAGTLAAFAIFFLIRNHVIAHAVVMLSMIVLGVCVSTEAEHIYKEKDSHKIVIDEVAGYFVTMFLIANPTLWMMVIGFFLNRIFDILKPYPIRRIEQLHGGLGIMLDDVVAGVYSNICLRLIIILLTVR
ncbi:MAG TPA: phosphatidylglycerophosphatase A [bacterium]|nr:phosphatidylglycerophosphatase A [bacterium]